MTLPRLEVIILPEVRMEINKLYDYIAFDLFSPTVAREYRDGILDKIYSLALTGNMFAVNHRDSLQQEYGVSVRTAKYKKMTIIYTIENNFVIVHSVRPGNTIK